MMKLSFCLRRRPGMDRQAFLAYWRETHAPLVRRHAQALGIRRYVQQHTLEGPLAAALAASRGGPEPFDGIAEIWWDDLASLERALAAPEARAASQALLEDEKKFIDLPRSPLWLSEEHVIVEEEEPWTSKDD